MNSQHQDLFDAYTMPAEALDTIQQIRSLPETPGSTPTDTIRGIINGLAAGLLIWLLFLLLAVLAVKFAGWNGAR